MTAHIDDDAAYDQPKTGQVVIFLINQAFEIKDLNHHLLCLLLCHMNGVVINEVPKFLAPIPSETMHAIQTVNCFNIIHLIVISLKLNRVTNYFDVKKPT